MLLDEKKNMHEIQKLFFYLEVHLSLIVQCLTPIVHEKMLQALFLFGNSSHIEIIGEKIAKKTKELRNCVDFYR